MGCIIKIFLPIFENLTTVVLPNKPLSRPISFEPRQKADAGTRCFTSSAWNPVEEMQEFGALAFVYGTVATSVIAMLIAVPLGVATAAFLSEIAPGWLRRIVSFLVEMLAAIPSVVYGFWGMFIFAPKFMQPVITWMGGPNTGGAGRSLGSPSIAPAATQALMVSISLVLRRASFSKWP